MLELRAMIEQNVWLRVGIVVVLGLMCSWFFVPAEIKQAMVMQVAYYSGTLSVVFAMPLLIGAVAGWLYYDRKVFFWTTGWLVGTAVVAAIVLASTGHLPEPQAPPAAPATWYQNLYREP